MPVKAPPPLPAPINSWTGWYVGANVGGGWGHRDVSFTPNDPIAAQIVPPPQSFTTSGVVGGLQLGYNWRLQPNWPRLRDRLRLVRYERVEHSGI
jgi:outer membrane immunogenic protein